MQEPSKKILLGMLVANGDCLLATVIARQIKKDYPGCHLTWAISNLCRQVIENNPDVDQIWEVELNDKKQGEQQAWYAFQEEASQRKSSGEFDEVFFTQVYPSNVHRYDGTTRGTIYNSYPHPVTVDARPVLRLYPDEIDKVRQFAEQYRLKEYKDVLLFECSSFSGQSFVDSHWAMQVALGIVEKHTGLLIIISTHQELKSAHSRIIAGNSLSLRQNAELTKYCTLLVGCSSGITWISISDWAKRLPMIQFLKRGVGFSFASVVYDHKYWGQDHSMIIETNVSGTDYAVRLITEVMEQGIEKGKAKYHKDLRPRFISMLKYCFMFFRRGKFSKAWRIAVNFTRRNYIRKRR